jgi:hypothetical protein
MGGAVIGAAIFLLAGCSGNTNDASYNVSGSITYDGKPIPRGIIRFSPDESKGNKGAVGFCEIKDGKYNTAKGKQTQGIEGGAYIIRVTGYDGEAYKTDEGDNFPKGRKLFEVYMVRKELPSEDTTLDLDITADDVTPVADSGK